VNQVIFLKKIVKNVEIIKKVTPKDFKFKQNNSITTNAFAQTFASNDKLITKFVKISRIGFFLKKLVISFNNLVLARRLRRIFKITPGPQLQKSLGELTSIVATRQNRVETKFRVLLGLPSGFWV
jgi:hypothetical protein